MAKAKKKKPRNTKLYTGALAERIAVQEPDLLTSYAEPGKYHAELFARRLKKVPLLFKHYGIDQRAPAADLQLVVRLAADYVPGFKTLKRAGRPRSSSSLDMDLYVHVRWWQLHHPSDSVLTACTELKRMGVEAFLELTTATAMRRFKLAKQKKVFRFDARIPPEKLRDYFDHIVGR